MKYNPMKNIFALMIPLAILLSGCAPEELMNNDSEFIEGRIFTASFEQETTRTYIENGNLLRWNEGDQISIFDGNTLNRQYQFDGETGDNGGTFSIVSKPFGTGNDLDCHYALYPYESDVKISENGVITTTLPAEQSYAENSFGLKSNTMVAITKNLDDTFLKFKNVGGFLKLQLYGKDVTVKTITLTGNSDEKLAGQASITPSYGQDPTIVMASDATQSITLNCGEDGVKIGESAESATDFWIVVPPVTFENGFKITITDINGSTFTKSTSNKIAIELNIIRPMTAFEVEIEKIPNNQIWYTSSNGAIVAPYNVNGFDAEIESNVYEDGKGIITFKGDITTIGDDAFGNRSYLTSIVLPNSVTTIGIRAFDNCSSLTNVTIPNNVTTIKTCAFNGCQRLTNITIPNSVTDIENGVFAYCQDLKEFQGKFASDGGRCLIKDNAIIAYANASGTEYTIPNNVTTILSGTFIYSPLIEITIPDNVTTIQPSAFICPNLKTIKGKYATADGRFYIIDGAIKIYAPYGLSHCIIPDSVTNIEYGTFVGKCTSLTIPESVTEISFNAFKNNINLTDIYCQAVTPPTAVFNYNSWDAFPGNANIYVPVESVMEYRKAAGWKNYADRIVAFDYDKGEAVISSNIIYYTSVDGNIVTPYNTGRYVFGAEIVSNTYENGLGIIKFDRDVLSIGWSSFKWCNTLKSIVIPDSVTEIESYAFYECSNLTSVTIGNKVTSIGDDAFRYCSNITSVNISDIESWCNIKFNNSSSNPLQRECNLYIGGTLLTNLVIPNSVTSICDYAFCYCLSLTSVTIPDSVTSIGTEAFYFCKNLKSLTIGNNVTTIGNEAFLSCASLTNVTIGNSVTQIGDSAFACCDNLESVKIPESMVMVGETAFYLCENLRKFEGKFASADGRCLIVDGVLNSFAPAEVTEYNIPYGVTTIGTRAFYYCQKITKVTMPDSVTSIGDYAFQDCKNLSIVTIGNKVTTIGEYAFEYCTSLTSVIIPDSVTSIGSYALHSCMNLTNVVIGKNTTFLGQGVLYDCDNLTSVTMGDNVTTIEYNAFYDCDKLTTITIPASVTSIASYAFANCDKLTAIYCKSSTPTEVSYPQYWHAFDNNSSGCKIYVPQSSVNAYKMANGWSDYASNIVGYNF